MGQVPRAQFKEGASEYLVKDRTSVSSARKGLASELSLRNRKGKNERLELDT